MLQGIPASGGFAIGKIVKLEEQIIAYEQRSSRGEKAEQRRYEAALCAFTQKTQAAAGALRRIVGKEEADIFTGHIFMAHDPDMQKQVKAKIAGGFSAEMAMETACESFIQKLLSAQSDFARQRAADVRDVKQSFLSILTNAPEAARHIPFGSVIAAKELTPSAVHLMDKRRTVAAVAEQGERACHFAILMRAMGIPAVLSVSGLMERLHTAQKVIVDGDKGEIIPV